VALFGFCFWNPKAAVAAIIMSAIRLIHGLGLCFQEGAYGVFCYAFAAEDAWPIFGAVKC